MKGSKVKNRIVIQTLATILIAGNMVYAQSPAEDYIVGQRTIHYEDASRARKLTTEIWYPAIATAQPVSIDQIPFKRMPTAWDAKIADGRYPLILFSHGTGGGRSTVEWFCTGLAKKGFVVVAVDHYGNTFDNPIPEEFARIWNRPLDISYVLTQILNHPEFAPAIDSSRIGAAGFSLGGYTAIALAGAEMDWPALIRFFKSPKGSDEINIPEMPGLMTILEKPEMQKGFESAPSLHDRRIKAIFVMAPAVGQGFPTRKNFSRLHVPTYIVTTGADVIVPAATNAAHYAKLIPGATYNLIDKDAGHYVFLNEANEELKNNAPLHFSDPPSVNRHAVHEKTVAHALRFFTDSLKGTLRNSMFINNGYL